MRFEVIAGGKKAAKVERKRECITCMYIRNKV